MIPCIHFCLLCHPSLSAIPLVGHLVGVQCSHRADNEVCDGLPTQVCGRTPKKSLGDEFDHTPPAVVIMGFRVLSP